MQSEISPKVSILIGSRDRFEPLTRCLQSVLTQAYPSLEVLVLDDNSSQYNLGELLTSKFRDTELRCFRSEQSLGVAEGRNFLMRQASGDIFCVIDDDAYFADSNCVRQLVEAFRCHPQAGILATKILDHRPDQINLKVPFSQRQRKKRPSLIAEKQLVSYFLGGCHAIRRNVIECCGSYQPDLMFGEEELDLSYRAISMGFQIIYLPDVVVHHHPEPSLLGRSTVERRPELYYHVRNRFFLSYKYLPFIYVPVYLSVWLTVYGTQALREGTFKEFLRGIRSGLKRLKTLKRTPLNPSAVQYLKNYHGRLWY